MHGKNFEAFWAALKCGPVTLEGENDKDILVVFVMDGGELTAHSWYFQKNGLEPVYGLGANGQRLTLANWEADGRPLPGCIFCPRR